ncbi:MAG: ferredoxin [Candidatus Limnocylindrales bacterium]
MSGAQPMQLAVDRIRCDGSALCAEILPELISLDDWGYPILLAAPVPNHLLDLARQAVDACPVLALRLQGTVNNPGSGTQTARAARVRAR